MCESMMFFLNTLLINTFYILKNLISFIYLICFFILHFVVFAHHIAMVELQHRSLLLLAAPIEKNLR